MDRVLLHLGSGAGTGGVELVDALLAAVLLAAAAAVPFALGLWLAGRWRGAPRTFAGFAVGAVLFLSFDLLREAALGAALLRPAVTVGLLVAFAAGLLLPAWLPRKVGARAPGALGWPAFLWTAGIGAHALGEGFVVGTEAHDALTALPLLGAVSFLLHKVVEGASVRALAERPANADGILTLAAVAALPAAVGALLGALLGPSILGPLAFALGAGAAVWALVSVARKSDGSVAFYAAALVGVLAVYGAGLLHEVP